MATTTETTFQHLLAARAKLVPPGGGPGGGQKPQYSLSGGYPDPGSFPYDDLVQATARMMREEGAEALTYGEAQGYLPLRELICRKYQHFESLAIGPENVLIANGSSHALSLAFSAFVDVGDAIICEAPTFSGTLNTIRRHGADVHTVPVDADGIVTSAVREQLAALRAEGRSCKLIYTLPNFHNPAGPTATLQRRQELIALAHEFETLILEDDAYGELRFEGEPLPSLYALDDRGVVIRSGTVSKILGAGMRLGWLIAPTSLVPYLQAFNFGGGVAPFTSRIATYYLRDHIVEHVAQLVEIYRRKRDAMLEGLNEVLEGTDAEISHPQGGFFIWIKLPAAADPAKVAQLAKEAGVAFVPGANFFPHEGGERHIRLAYSYETEEKCFEGAKTIAWAIRGAMG
jgi:2-aminoadipate transaminase